MEDVDFDIEIDGENVMIMINGNYPFAERLKINNHIAKEMNLNFAEQIG